MSKKRLVLFSLAVILVLVAACQQEDLPPEPGAPGVYSNPVGMAGAVYQGYGPIYDVFNDNQLIFNISPDNFTILPGQSTFEITYSVNLSGGFIYKTGYYYNTATLSWVAFTLPGEIPGKNWIRDNASTTLSLDVADFDTSENLSENYIVAFACKKYSGVWRCGCTGITGPCNMWMLQTFDLNKPASCSQGTDCPVDYSCNSSQCVHVGCIGEGAYTPGTISPDYRNHMAHDCCSGLTALSWNSSIAGCENPKVGGGLLCTAKCGNGVCDSDEQMCTCPQDCHVVAGDYCANEVKDANESDVDCGGACAVKCAVDKSCSVNGDCLSGSCVNEKCAAVVNIDYCANGVKDSNESDVDCGGVCPTKCGVDKDCSVDADCLSGTCLSGSCIAAPPALNYCVDSVKDSNESDVDCGGVCSVKCVGSKACSVNADCLSGSCQGGACVNVNATGKPDLIVENISVENTQVGDLNSVDFLVFVKNIGNALANKSRVKVTLEPPQPYAIGIGDKTFFEKRTGATAPIPMNDLVPGDILLPGQRERFYEYFEPSQSGDINITVYADTYNEVDELNEQNNVRSQLVSVNATISLNYCTSANGTTTQRYNDIAESIRDNCTDVNSLERFGCDGKFFVINYTECPNGCQDGACMQLMTKKQCPQLMPSTPCNENQTWVTYPRDANGCYTGGTCVNVTNYCANGVKESNESDVDCGGVCLTKCVVGKSCSVSGDCLSGNCVSGKCAAVVSVDYCSNSVKDANESDVDCGGVCAAKCAIGQSCVNASNCLSGYCTSSKCVTSTCSAPDSDNIYKASNGTGIVGGATTVSMIKDYCYEGSTANDSVYKAYCPTTGSIAGHLSANVIPCIYGCVLGACRQTAAAITQACSAPHSTDRYTGSSGIGTLYDGSVQTFTDHCGTGNALFKAACSASGYLNWKTLYCPAGTSCITNECVNSTGATGAVTAETGFTGMAGLYAFAAFFALFMVFVLVLLGSREN